MDFTQLPKMSKTPATPAAADVDPGVASDQPATAVPPRPVAYARPDFALSSAGGLGFGGVWVSLISGILCLLFGLNFGKWLLATLAGRPYLTGVLWKDEARFDQPVTYFDLLGGTAWTEAGLFLMGVALLLDAALMFVAFRGRSPHRALVLAAILVTGAALAINAGVAVYVFSLGGLPMTSIVALLVGGMVLFDHLPLLKRGRGTQSVAAG